MAAERSKKDELTDGVFHYDAANEAIVISAAIADAHTRKTLVHRIAADEFLVPRHSLIWTALRRLADSDLTFTKETVTRLVEDAGGDESAISHVLELAEEAEIPENLDWHVDTMRWDATRARTLQGPVPEFIAAIRDPKAAVSDVMSNARRVVRALEGRARRYIHRSAELNRQYRAELAARRMQRNLYPLGFDAFDAHLTEGFMPGRISVVSGLPGSGKSTVMIAWAVQLAKIGRKPLYCAWEMEPFSLIDVAVSHLTGIKLQRVVQGTLTDAENDRVCKAAAWTSSKIKFMENPFLRQSGKKSNDRNLDILEGYIAESGCDIAIYDLWKRMLVWRSPDDEEGALVRMQDMHKEYGIHGIIVQQLRLKDVESRRDKRPTRESIKGSAAYVEIPDLIFGVHRDGQLKDVPDKFVETINLKQRKGKAFWACRWQWDGATCAVKSPQEVPYNPGFEADVDGADIGQSATSTSVKSLKTSTGERKGRRL